MGALINYVLLNDTSHTNNPGCQGTVSCLHGLLQSNGMSCLRSHPVGFGEQRFWGSRSQMARSKLTRRFGWLRPKFGKQRATYIEANNLGWRRPPLSFEPTEWEAAACKLEQDYKDFFAEADVVVINGEGTIHHNQPGAAALVAWARAAARNGCAVFTVNCTIQAMDAYLLDALFSASQRVVVREPWSFKYLYQNGYLPVQGSDALFAWPDLPRPRYTAFDRRRCIYSPGVLATDNAITGSIVGEQIRRFIEAGWAVSYLTIEIEDERFEATAKHVGASIYPLRRWTAANLFSILQQHDVVVSGRYHLMIFAWLAGRPVLPMMSNSWKLEGLLEMAGMPPDSVYSPYHMLNESLDQGLLPGPTVLERLRALAFRNAEVEAIRG